MRAFAAFLVALTLLVRAAEALATVSVQNVVRSGEGHDDAGAEFEFYVSRSDCESSEVFTFPFTITNPGDYDRLEVWLAENADCKVYMQRDGTEDDACTLLQTIDVDDSGEIEIASSAIADAVRNVEGCIDSTGGDGDHAVTIYFLAIATNGSDVPAEDAAEWTNTHVDLIGPAPPTELKANDAEEAVKIGFTASTADDLQGYYVYCDPGLGTTPMGGVTTGAGGGGGSGGGGTGGGGTGSGGGGGGGTTSTTSTTTTGAETSTTTGGTTGGDCPSSALVAGQPPPDVSYRCGPPLGETAPLQGLDEVTVSGLMNDTKYAIAIAGVDNLGNPGPLSEVVCGEPREVDDFFGEYREAGGKGGGGYCTAAANGGIGLPAGVAMFGLFFGGVVAWAVRRRRARRIPKAGPWLVVALLLVAPRLAEAQQKIPDYNWRQEDRKPIEPADTQFAFEVRFGPYWPAVDSEPGLGGRTPYQDTFGTDGRFYFGLEFDWMPLRIPYLGMFGPGAGWGYTWASEKAKFTGCTPRDSEECTSEDVTSLTIMPMHVSAVLRADELMRRTEVPFVPYTKVGFGFAPWSAAQTSGLSVVEEEQGGKKVEVEGEGWSWGIHFALGGMLALNWLDTGSSGRLRESTGIAHVYLFGEWMHAALNGFGAVDMMYVGTSTVIVGLAADF